MLQAAGEHTSPPRISCTLVNLGSGWVVDVPKESTTPGTALQQ